MEDALGRDAGHADVVFAGGVVFAVVAGAAGERRCAAEGGYSFGLGEGNALEGVGGAEEGQGFAAGELCEVERAAVMGDEEIAGLVERDELAEVRLADEVFTGKVCEMGEDPSVGRRACEEDVDAAVQELFCEGDVVLDGPSAEGVVSEEVFCAAGGEGDCGRGTGRGGRERPSGKFCEGRVGAFCAEEEMEVLLAVVSTWERGAVFSREEAVIGCAGEEGEEAVARVGVRGEDEIEEAQFEGFPEFVKRFYFV